MREGEIKPKQRSDSGERYHEIMDEIARLAQEVAEIRHVADYCERQFNLLNSKVTRLEGKVDAQDADHQEFRQKFKRLM